MMHSEAAIRLIAELEKASAADTEVFAKLKFNYVVACQVCKSKPASFQSIV